MTKAEHKTAFLKVGILGFQGSGKTYTASEIAIGLCKLEKKKRVGFYATEPGLDFVLKNFKKEGIEVFEHRGRAFRDLITVIKECEREGFGALIIDSISHVWKELMQAYKIKLKRRRGLYFSDWDAVKTEWQQFSDLYVNSKIHIIMCGRAGYEYENTINEETGKPELIKTGTKMKVENEVGFEPSLLLEMVRVRRKDNKGWINQCVVLKDRTQMMNGHTIDYPTFKSFKPVIDDLSIGGEHIGVDTERTSEDLFDDPNSTPNVSRERSIQLEELNAMLVKMGLDGTSSKAKLGRTELLEQVYGTASKTAIEALWPDKIQSGIKIIKDIHTANEKKATEKK
jgi:hypothetical protein